MPKFDTSFNFGANVKPKKGKTRKKPRSNSSGGGAGKKPNAWRGGQGSSLGS